MRVHPAPNVGEALPEEPRHHQQGESRVEPTWGSEQPAHHRRERRPRVEGAGDRFFGLRREPFAPQLPARLPLEISDQRHSERSEDREEQADHALLLMRVSARDFDRSTHQRVRRKKEERVSDPAREDLVPPGVVLFLVRQVAQVAHRKKRGAPLDDALEAEREEGETARANGFEKREASLAENVEERQSEQPAHAPPEAPVPVSVASRRRRARQSLNQRAILRSQPSDRFARTARSSSNPDKPE